MCYSSFEFGVLYLGNKIQYTPQIPTSIGDVPQYDGQATISIGAAKNKKNITWVKPDGQNILISDRVLLVTVSWDDLERNGMVNGKLIVIDGQFFNCRLLQVSKSDGVPNEWDKILDETGEDNDLWHWENMFFLGTRVNSIRDGASFGSGVFLGPLLDLPLCDVSERGRRFSPRP